MRKALYINIGNRAKLDVDISNDHLDLLDITNSIQDYQNKIHLNEFDDFQRIVDKGLESYLEFTDQLASNIDANKFLITGFPLYWLTSVSEKHPIYHWGKRLFLGLEFLNQKKELIKNDYSKVYLGLGSEMKTFEESISAHFNKTFGTSIKLEFDFEKSQGNSLNWWALFKQIFSYFRSIRSSPTIHEKPLKNDLFFGRYAEDNKPDQLYNSLNLIFEEEKIELGRISNEFTKAYPFPSYFKKYAPSLIDCALLYAEIISKYYKVRKKLFEKRNVELHNGLVLPMGFLLDEYREALIRNSHILIYSIWFTKFFKSRKADLRVYFEDEFYKIGRLISHGARSFEKIRTYGIQHGNFDRLHTVYSITEKELSAGIPIPDHFISWGKIYSDSFRELNDLDSSYTLTLGNPSYINEYKGLVSNKVKSRSLLWCLTTLECMKIEWQIIKPTLIEGQLNVEIRLHPGGHIAKEDIQTMIGNDIVFSFSEEKSIRDAILKNELIVVSAHSTVFIDALACKKKCIRLLSRYYDGFKKVNSATLRTVSNPKDFGIAYEELVNLVESEIDLNELLVLEKGHWNEFIVQ